MINPFGYTLRARVNATDELDYESWDVETANSIEDVQRLKAEFEEAAKTNYWGGITCEVVPLYDAEQLVQATNYCHSIGQSDNLWYAVMWCNAKGDYVSSSGHTTMTEAVVAVANLVEQLNA
jgi:hypothetical protein